MGSIRRFTGNQMQVTRLVLDMNQDELAQLLGVTKLTISRWENGGTKIPLHAEAVVRVMLAESVGQTLPVRELLIALSSNGARVPAREET